MEVYVPASIEHGKQNPYPPGSREYVGHKIMEEPNIMQPAARRAMYKPIDADWTKTDKAGHDLIIYLRSMLDQRPPVRTMCTLMSHRSLICDASHFRGSLVALEHQSVDYLLSHTLHLHVG